MAAPETGLAGELGGGEMEAVKVMEIMEQIRSVSEETRIAAAKEIRRLTKTSSRHRRQLSAAVEPLVSMLRSRSPDCGEAAILALVNLAVKDERNKIKIVECGALEPLIHFLQGTNSSLQEYATAALLTLSASLTNKPIISASGAIPLLVKILRDGNPQAKVDAVMALYNLSTIPENLNFFLPLQPIPALIHLLKSCKKSSRTAEKCTALLESLVSFEEGRTALTAAEAGVLTIVQVLEEGSLRSKEHAVGALLTMCESDQCKYRELILKEGAIPGLLQLTIQGTRKSRVNARSLLQLLRSSCCRRPELETDALDSFVCGIVSNIEGDDQVGKAKKMLAEMVQVSMEQSLRHLQQRASVRTSDGPSSW
ncbi:U-box domain-containing protein 4-like [Canna indica]|uniref:U-box domain-containing protein 4-like n=1 Tax=Canna indica TaxID=4628 RepID=A0AAQ3JQA7_9LILI|nr:U-box domain-containing protein 4-like [Canna indica]